MPETRINTGFRHFNPVPGHTPLSSKGKIQYPHYPHIPLQNHTAKPSGTAAQFHSTFRSGNPDNPTSIASHITVSSYTATLSQCHFHSIVQSIPHTLQHQEISTFTILSNVLQPDDKFRIVPKPYFVSICLSGVSFASSTC